MFAPLYAYALLLGMLMPVLVVLSALSTFILALKLLEYAIDSWDNGHVGFAFLEVLSAVALAIVFYPFWSLPFYFVIDFLG